MSSTLHKITELAKLDAPRLFAITAAALAVSLLVWPAPERQLPTMAVWAANSDASNKIVAVPAEKAHAMFDFSNLPAVEAPKLEPVKVDPAAAKQDAIDLLMKAYNDGKSKEVKDLLGEFGVKKFGELDESKGPDLLERAKELAA